MDREKSRHYASWFFTVALETVAGTMTWLGDPIITLLFFGGIVTLVIGYWPELRGKFIAGQIFAIAFAKQAAISIVALSAVYWVGVIAMAEYRYFSIIQPELFRPEGWALQSRVFVTESPGEITGYFTKYTNWRANEILKDYIGKWYAVTGIVNDVTPFPEFKGVGKNMTQIDAPYINLEYRPNSAATLIAMTFQDKWQSRAKNFNKGERISVYCKIASIRSFSLTLEQCQIVQR